MIKLDSLISYLPTLLTALLIVPLGAYVKNRLTALATKEDFKGAIAQLEISTKAVESIKNQMNEKYWVKQQIWETKRVAYEELITSLYFTQKYLNGLVSYYKDYLDCFVYIGCSTGAAITMPGEEEFILSYQKYIESDQAAFKDRFESPEFKKKQQDLLNETKCSFTKLEDVFSIKSIYLHTDLKLIELKIGDLKGNIFDENLSLEEGEDQDMFYDRVLEHYLDSQKLLVSLIEETKCLAAQDLSLKLNGTIA
jgi:hypothetical protein